MGDLHTAEEVITFLTDAWWHWESGVKISYKQDLTLLELHTHGWSDNEELIDQLMQHQFWFFFWTKSERGGHYYFEIPKDCLTEKLWKN